jgi:hypothetical protein
MFSSYHSSLCPWLGDLKFQIEFSCGNLSLRTVFGRKGVERAPRTSYVDFTSSLYKLKCHLTVIKQMLYCRKCHRTTPPACKVRYSTYFRLLYGQLELLDYPSKFSLHLCYLAPLTSFLIPLQSQVHHLVILGQSVPHQICQHQPHSK